MGFGSTTSSQQSTQNQFSPAQQAYQNAAANWATGQIGQQGPAYTGQTTAPLSPQQQGLIGQMGTTGAEGTGANQAGLNALAQIAGGQYLNDPFTSAYLQSTANYANQNFQNQIPGMEAQFIGAGQTGPSSPMAQYLAGQNATFNLGLQNQLATQGLNQYNTQFGAMQNAANQAAAQGQAAASAGLSALAQPQQTQQQAYNTALQLWQLQQEYPWMAAGMYGNLAQTPLGQTSTGSTTQTQSPLSALASMLNLDMTV